MAKLKKHIITLDTYGNMDLTEYANSLESFTILCKDTNNIYHKGSDINTVIVGTDDLGIDEGLKYVQNGSEYELFMNIGDGEFRIPKTIKNKQNIVSVNVPKHHYNTTTNMGSNIRIIGSNAFVGCLSLTHVSLSQFIKFIGESSFKDCANLLSVELPKTIETIESGSFYNCISLDGIVLPNITTIESETFYGCESLKQITIPNTVKSIGKNAFKGCDALTEITFKGTHEQWKRIDTSNAGFDALKLVLCTNGNYNYITGELDIDENKVIRYKTNNGKAVATYINDWVSNTYDVKAGEGMIIFKSNITSIGFDKLKGTYSGYFSNNLVSIELPTCCTEIKSQTFYECTNLTNINLENVEKLGYNTFYRCSKLETLTADTKNELTKLTETGQSVFVECDALKRVVISDSLETIEGYLFSGCNVLSEITIGNKVSKINTNAIYNCNNGQSVRLLYNGTLDGWTNITKTDKYAWYTKTNISEVKCIQDGAIVVFGNPEDCTIEYEVYDKTDITINIAGNYIEDSKFDSKEQAGIVQMASRVENLVPEMSDEPDGDISCFSSDLTAITLPRSVTTIGYRAFAGTKLYDIDLRNTFTTEIGTWAFSSCSRLTTIKLPKTLQYIDKSAFDSCSELETVIFADTKANCAKIQFNDCFSLETTPKVAFITCSDGKYYFGQDDNTTTGTTPPTPPTPDTPQPGTGDDELETVNYTLYYTSSILSVVSILPEYKTTTKRTVSWNSVNENKYDAEKNQGHITFKNSLTDFWGNIGEAKSCFTDGREKLVTVSLPKCCTELHDYAFAECKGLKKINLKNVTQIGQHAFANCESLTSIELSRDIISIGIEAFNGCKKLETITFWGDADDWNSIELGDNWYVNTKLTHIECKYGDNNVKLDDIYLDDEETINNPLGNWEMDEKFTQGRLIWVETNDGTQPSIDKEKMIIKVDGMERNWNTFIKTKQLKEGGSLWGIEFKNPVTHIYGYNNTSCFGKTILKSLRLPDECTELHDSAFKDNTNLKVVQLEHIEYIGQSVFEGCNALKSIKLTSKLTGIGKNAFKNCKNLKQLIFDGTTEEWDNIHKGTGWFYGTQLKQVVDLSLTPIADIINNDDDVVMDTPTGDWELGDKEFNNGYAVYYTSFDDNQIAFDTKAHECIVNNIKKTDYEWNTIHAHNAYNKNTHCGYISFKHALTDIYGDISTHTSFAGDDTINLECITLPDECINIHQDAFYGCVNLKQINLENVKLIETNAFKGCVSLTKIILNKNVTIQENAFSGCNKLTSIVYHGTETDWNTNHKESGSISPKWRGVIDAEKETITVTCAGGKKINLTSITNDDNIIIDTPTGDWELGDKEFYNGYAVFYTSSDDTQIAFDTNVKKCIVNGIEKANYKWNEIHVNKAYNKKSHFGFISFKHALTDIYGDISTHTSFAGDDTGNLACITLPDECINIRQDAFYGCSKLKQINLASVKLIETNAFLGCTSLRKIILNKNVTIQENAFEGCNNLTSIVYHGTEADWNSNYITDGSISPKWRGVIDAEKETITVTFAGGKKIYLGKQPAATTETSNSEE
jgi:hypothetical protein